MSFWDVFIKTWQVRTSIRIQESIEDSFSRYNERLLNDRTEASLVVDLINANSSWDKKLEKSRQQIQTKCAFAKCEYCSEEYKILEYKKIEPVITGFIFVNQTVYRAQQNNIAEITEMIQMRNVETLFFYCSKKCLLSDTTIHVENFKD